MLEELLQEMSNIGLLEYNWGESETREAVCPSDVCTGKCRVFNMKLDQIKEHPEVASFFERMAFYHCRK